MSGGSEGRRRPRGMAARRPGIRSDTPAVNAALLRDLAEQHGVDAVYLEKDFVLTEIIHAYAAGPYGDALVLKGGQALRHIYGSPRFSKDVDYIARRRIEFADLMDALNIRYPRLQLPVEPAGRTSSGLHIEPVEYRGPLGQLDNVEIEVSFRRDLALEPQRVTYRSLLREPFDVLVMDLNEMVAEKLRAMYQRGNPRDLYDLWFIFTRLAGSVDAGTVARLVPGKFRPPLVRGGWDRSRLFARMDEERHTWDDALDALAPDHPTFGEARATVERATRFLPR
ncbi:MAG: nucleotidyl transferase AbiEii/AbiGii toxin family protein [Chloroflexi bacterium]|nr:nucleotidyl transferase AbiEii/AbiGii toxin family protein [Chloroflexota bacterium]